MPRRYTGKMPRQSANGRRSTTERVRHVGGMVDHKARAPRDPGTQFVSGAQDSGVRTTDDRMTSSNRIANAGKVNTGRKLKLAGSIPSGARVFSPEVQAVLDRMSALTEIEIDAIEIYVDGLVTDNAYDKITEIYAPCLNATDFLTGFKFMTLQPSAIAPVHTPGEYVDFQNGNMHYLDSADFSSFATLEGFIAVYNVFTGADVTQNSDLFGVADAGGRECYYRWRGNDTNDSNVLYNVTGATPRHIGTVRPQGDLVGMGLEGTDVFELQPGGIIEKAARTTEGVPVGHPCQWHGQNLSGTPAAGNVQNSRYSLMIHANGPVLSTIVQGVVRNRSLQFLKDIGVTGVP